MQNRKVKLNKNVTVNKWEGTNQASPPEQLSAGMLGEAIGRAANYYGEYIIVIGLDGTERYIKPEDLDFID